MTFRIFLCMPIFFSMGASLCAKECKDFNDVCSQADQFVTASRFCPKDERGAAFKRRLGAACLRTIRQKKNIITCENNGDEKKVPFFAAQFSKGLEHDPITGLLTTSGRDNYRKLLTALKTGSQKDFNAIALASSGSAKFANPQGSFTFSLSGTDSSLFKLKLFPTLSSPEAAALLLEMYLLQLCRDVLFSDYGTGMGSDATNTGTGSLTKNAAIVLQDLGSAYTGPRNQSNVVDFTVLFRGNTYGNLLGPYLSQFLLLDIRTNLPKGVGFQNVNQSLFVGMQQLRPSPAPSSEFGVSMSDFVSIQNGLVPKQYTADSFLPATRYIIDGRDLAGFVHTDTPYEGVFNALSIIFASGFPFSKASPYVNGTIKNESPFVTLGIADVFSMIGDISAEVSKAAWAHKWRAERVLRPDAFGGLLQNSKQTNSNPFNLDKSLFETHGGINVLSLVQAHNADHGASTCLLSQVFPEGSPLHPSYPANHGSIAGAGITVIKAIFDDTVKISSIITPVKVDPTNPRALIMLPISEGANDITLASELDKLAFNMAFGRSFAGIHYRADVDEGVLLGEECALLYLQDRAAMITEETFAGFELTKIDGTRIRITATSVENI